MRYSVINEEKVSAKKLSFGLIEKMPKISEWFLSLEGEGQGIGEPSLYIRLAGCYSAKCSWCDSKYSWFTNDGEKELEDIAKNILKTVKNPLDIKRLTITGGEPLHFIKNIPDIVQWLVSLGFSFDFIGIESNGNLLQNKEAIYETVKAFGVIQMDFNDVQPVLTISPKLNAKDCYNDELTDKEIETMYNKVYINSLIYLNKDNLYFKFVWIMGKDNVEILSNIESLLSVGVERRHIMLMPWTPEDPYEKDKEIWAESQQIASRKALELGIKYSPRLHIDIKMD